MIVIMDDFSWDKSKLDKETFKAWQTFWTTTPALKVPEPAHSLKDIYNYIEVGETVDFEGATLQCIGFAEKSMSNILERCKDCYLRRKAFCMLVPCSSNRRKDQLYTYFIRIK